jgi:hypothetical protein
MKINFNFEDDPIDYVLEYDFNAIADAEPVAGCNLLSAVSNMGAMTATQMRGLLYALLKKNHPAVLLHEAGALLTRDTMMVTTALAKAMGAKDEEPAEAEQPEEAAVA